MKIIQRLIQSCVYFICACLLCACKPVMLDPKGIIAADEKNIMLTSAALMLMIVIPVIILTLLVAWRYRESNTKTTYMPEWSHSVLLEIIWWTIPCIIISILAYITWFSSHNLDPYKPLDSKLKPVVIQAVALRWKWLFIYPEHNIATINFVQIPVNTPVTFLITAEGPMNSLQIPQLAGQIYAMAGMQSKLHIMAQAPGEYRGISANFSGQGFSDMKFTVRAGSKDEFDRWVLQAKQSPELLTYGVYSKLTQPSINEAVKYFVSSRDDIFQTVAMQPMMPAKTTGNLCKPVLASR